MSHKLNQTAHMTTRSGPTHCHGRCCHVIHSFCDVKQSHRALSMCLSHVISISTAAFQSSPLSLAPPVVLHRTGKVLQDQSKVCMSPSLAPWCDASRHSMVFLCQSFSWKGSERRLPKDGEMVWSTLQKVIFLSLCEPFEKAKRLCFS